MPQKLGHGTDSFTSPPEEGMLRIFTPVKNQRLRPGLNPQTWVPEASMLTTRPPKPSIEAIRTALRLLNLHQNKFERAVIFSDSNVAILSAGPTKL